ncbi:MAG: Phosphocholine transferase AnkX [Syntrophus sp. PtaB.Bin138]|nr:MAG: Phosphocholine transferase AnkX [Syntrophus sp. PtaB.Bin138]
MKRIHFAVLFISVSLFMASAPVRAGEMFNAVLSDNKEKVGQLLALGAPVNSRYENQNTALHWAAGAGTTDVARLLIEKGADVNARNKNGWTPLHVAAAGGFYFVGHYRTALWKIESDNGKLGNEIRSRGAELSMRSERAGRMGDVSPLKDIMEPGNQYFRMAELLIGRGADVNARSKANLAPLDLALLYGDTKIASLLIEKGADVNINGEANLSMAICTGRTGVAAEMIRRGVKFDPQKMQTPLQIAAGHGWKEIAVLLIVNGVNVNGGKEEWEKSPLHWAARTGRTDMAVLLVEKGADVNLRDMDQQIPLHKAVSNGHTDIAAMLIAKGAEVSAKDKDGGTPLHVAVAQGQTKAVSLLIGKGADLNARDKDQWTPLHWAAAAGKTESARLLLEKGANVHARDGFQWTPAETAEQNGHPDLAAMIRSGKTSVGR